MRVGALLSALAFLVACDDDVISPTTGSLEVRISGLPTGAAASVLVTGPDAHSHSVTETTTITDLPLGTYTVAASEVTAVDSRWAPTPATQQKELTAGSPTAVTDVAYTVASARLAVNIAGLPNGVNANVTITGPGGYNNILTSSIAINLLTPGAYTITAAEVVSGGTTYVPAPPTQTIQLPASTTQIAANVVYAAGTGGLTVTVSGLPVGVDAAVQITGPSGYNQQLTGTQTISPLPPGTYTVTASEVASNLTTHTPAPASQTVTVTAGGTAAAAVTYSGAALELAVQEIISGLANPLYLTAPTGDPRLFIVEQPGRIRVYKNGALLTTPFLDITTIVQSGGEEGLLSVAFDPSYATNGRFYVYYTDKSGNIAVARYTATPGADIADANSRTEVLTIPHPNFGNHNGGLAMFGPDGMLYLGTGDGGGGGDPSNNGQNVNSLLGKLLRIDVTSLPYTTPATNPFAGATNGRDEIWAYGLRNPWRYAFDPTAGTLYIADVGQGSWEEINAMPAATGGLNYGWRIMEGAHCYPTGPCNATGLTLPVHEYSHAGGACSITGGFVYRGAAIPELSGHYLYSDYCLGWLRSLRVTGTTVTDHREWAIGSVGNVLSFGVDAAGELYMLSANGRVYRVVKG